MGYKVHLTETCQSQAQTAEGQAEALAAPHVIVQVQTTLALVQDVEVTASIQQGLADRGVLPEEQLVDAGYVDADLLVSRKPGAWDRLARPGLS